MMMELPRMLPTLNTENIVTKEAAFETEGFQRLIIGTAMAEEVSAQTVMTQTSKNKRERKS